MREDLRPLAAFYPEPEERHQMHYFFAHHFLPQYVHQNPYAFFMYLYATDAQGGPMDPTRFIQSRWGMFERRVGVIPRFPGLGGDMIFRRVEDLGMTTECVDSQAGALVRMPSPEQPVEAFFVAMVLEGRAEDFRTWSRDVRARVFTLEALAGEGPVLESNGIICEWSRDGTHLNYGGVVPPLREAFLTGIAAIIANPQTQPRAIQSPPTHASDPDAV